MQKSKKSKPLKRKTLQRPKQTNWLEFIKDDDLRLATPVGPRFQAQIPDWTGPPHKVYPCGCESAPNTSKWLGTQVWPIKGTDRETKDDLIGKGRADLCQCAYPGSIECVKRHITHKRTQLQFDLGSAFWSWKFNEMGEEVSKLWNLNEQKKFDSLVKMKPMSEGKSFWKPALETFSARGRESIVSYYFNVYVPRRMSMRTRSGCKVIDTDDDDDDDDDDGDDGEIPCSKGSRKRCRLESVPSYTSKFAKNRYLTGRR